MGYFLFDEKKKLAQPYVTIELAAIMTPNKDHICDRQFLNADVAEL